MCRGAVHPLQVNARTWLARSWGIWVRWGQAAGLVRSIRQLSDVERGSRRQGGGSRGRSGRRPQAPSTQHFSLETAGALGAQRGEVRVVVREPDAGHVAAVTPVHKARLLGARAQVLEEVCLAEVVGKSHRALVVGAAQGIDVGSVRAIWPHAIDMEAQHAGVGGPLPVSALIVIPQQLTASSHVPVKDLIVPGIGHDEVPILGPVRVSDEAAVTHTVAKVAGLGTITGSSTLLYPALCPGM